MPNRAGPTPVVLYFCGGYNLTLPGVINLPQLFQFLSKCGGELCSTWPFEGKNNFLFYYEEKSSN